MCIRDRHLHILDGGGEIRQVDPEYRVAFRIVDGNTVSGDVYACASVQKEIMPTCEFGTIRLPQGKYAVYTLQGLSLIHIF